MAESSLKLEQISTFFEDRIQTETAVGGTTVFIQRPKPKDEAGAASVSAADLPDDFTVDTVSANSTQLYRISFGPLDVVINLDLANMGAEIFIKLNIPILGVIGVGHVRGNLKNGVEAAIGYKGIATGKVGVRLDGSSVILYWDVSALGSNFKDEITLFTI